MVSVILPVYNRPTLVLEALGTVAAQTRPPDRLIVVDDGSTDDTVERVSGWLASSRLGEVARVVRQRNLGAAGARNRGADEADGADMLAFLDSDDLWPPDYLQRASTSFASAPEAVAATADQRKIDFATGRTRARSVVGIDEETPRWIVRNGHPGTSNTVIRASAYAAIGGCDESIRSGVEDIDLLYRLSLAGPWLYLRGAPVTYRYRLNERKNEAAHLTHHPDRKLMRAQVLERFLLENGAYQTIPRHEWRQRLARLWFLAARDLFETGRRTEAARCFRRTLELQPWNLRARWHSLRLAG